MEKKKFEKKSGEKVKSGCGNGIGFFRFGWLGGTLMGAIYGLGQGKMPLEFELITRLCHFCGVASIVVKSM